MAQGMKAEQRIIFFAPGGDVSFTDPGIIINDMLKYNL